MYCTVREMFLTSKGFDDAEDKERAERLRRHFAG